MTQTSWFDWDLGIDQYVNCKKNHLISKSIDFVYIIIIKIIYMSGVDWITGLKYKLKLFNIEFN